MNALAVLILNMYEKEMLVKDQMILLELTMVSLIMMIKSKANHMF